MGQRKIIVVVAVVVVVVVVVSFREKFLLTIQENYFIRTWLVEIKTHDIRVVHHEAARKSRRTPMSRSSICVPSYCYYQHNSA